MFRLGALAEIMDNMPCSVTLTRGAEKQSQTSFDLAFTKVKGNPALFNPGEAL
jgi:hypothetical protein